MQQAWYKLTALFCMSIENEGCAEAAAAPNTHAMQQLASVQGCSLTRDVCPWGQHRPSTSGALAGSRSGEPTAGQKGKQ